AKLENAILESNQRPKRRFISPATQAAVYARYFDAMRDHIEAVGTQRFPSVNGARQYGTLVMAITVNHDGRVLDRQILQAASNSVLNLHALALLDAMRFKSFDTALRASADELTVITRFNFLQDQTVSATLQAPK
ncbi:MAG: energy transducer TonB, partial [Burkholderiaceae bacterium]